MSDELYKETPGGGHCLYDREKHDPDQPQSILWAMVFGIAGVFAIVYGTAYIILGISGKLVRMFTLQ